MKIKAVDDDPIERATNVDLATADASEPSDDDGVSVIIEQERCLNVDPARKIVKNVSFGSQDFRYIPSRKAIKEEEEEERKRKMESNVVNTPFQDDGSPKLGFSAPYKPTKPKPLKKFGSTKNLTSTPTKTLSKKKSTDEKKLDSPKKFDSFKKPSSQKASFPHQDIRLTETPERFQLSQRSTPRAPLKERTHETSKPSQQNRTPMSCFFDTTPPNFEFLIDSYYINPNALTQNLRLEPVKAFVGKSMMAAFITTKPYSKAPSKLVGAQGATIELIQNTLGLTISTSKLRDENHCSLIEAYFLSNSGFNIFERATRLRIVVLLVASQQLDRPKSWSPIDALLKLSTCDQDDFEKFLKDHVKFGN